MNADPDDEKRSESEMDENAVSTEEIPAESDISQSADEESDSPHQEDSGAGDSESKGLDLEVEITNAGPCKKHVKLIIARNEVDKSLNESILKFRDEGMMPGFRPGKAPRQLVLKRYGKEVTNQVKSSLLMASMEQLDRDHQLNPLTEPDIDFENLELPKEGPFEVEFEVEVQPEFEIPDYKNLEIKRPIHQVTEAEIDNRYQNFLEREGSVESKSEGSAELGDFAVANITFAHQGQTMNQATDVEFRIQDQLRFRDGVIPNLAELLVGSAVGESRSGKAQIGQGSAASELRGQEVDVTIEVQELKTLQLPETDEEFFNRFGFDDESELRLEIRRIVERQYEHKTQEEVRRQVLDQLIERAPFDLPSELIKREEANTIRRVVTELQEAGYTENQIRAQASEIRENAHEVTLRKLKEFFLLGKIAEANELTADDDDLYNEIIQMAERSGESERRIRARLEKQGGLDELRDKILSRKVIDHILMHASVELEMVDASMNQVDVATIDQAAMEADQVTDSVDEQSSADSGADPEVQSSV